MSKTTATELTAHGAGAILSAYVLAQRIARRAREQYRSSAPEGQHVEFCQTILLYPEMLWIGHHRSAV